MTIIVIESLARALNSGLALFGRLHPEELDHHVQVRMFQRHRIVVLVEKITA